MNFISAINLGLNESLHRSNLSLLNRTAITDNDGTIIGYRATILVVADSNKYSKRNGEVVEGPNALTTFSVQVQSTDVPQGNQMIPNVQLIKPRVASLYATSQPGSTYASIHSTILCDAIRSYADAHKKAGEK